MFIFFQYSKFTFNLHDSSNPEQRNKAGQQKTTSKNQIEKKRHKYKPSHKIGVSQTNIARAT